MQRVCPFGRPGRDRHGIRMRPAVPERKKMKQPNLFNPYRMFFGSFIPTWLDERPEVSSTGKRVYAKLTHHAGKSGVAFPKQETLAEELGCTPRNIRKAISELAKHKLIFVQQLGRNKANRYFFLYHPWMGPDFPLDRNDSSAPDRNNSSAPLKRIIEKNPHSATCICKSCLGGLPPPQ